jgi:hypothetical protein
LTHSRRVLKAIPHEQRTRWRARFSLTGFTVTDRKIVAMDILADPERLRPIDLATLGE